MTLIRLLAWAFLLAHSVVAIFPFPVISTTCEMSTHAVWRPDAAGTCQVNYGTTVSYSSSTAKDSTLVTSDQQTTTGLSPVMIYRSQVVSVDASNNLVYHTSGTCDSPGSFIKIADNERSELRGRWRGGCLWCYKDKAPVSAQESDPTQITVITLSSERSGGFHEGTNQ